MESSFSLQNFTGSNENLRDLAHSRLNDWGVREDLWGLPFAPLLFTPASGRGLALSELCATALMSRRVLRCLEGGPRAPELRPGQIRPDLLQLVWRKQRWGKELGVGSAGRGRARRALSFAAEAGSLLSLPQGSNCSVFAAQDVRVVAPWPAWGGEQQG